MKRIIWTERARADVRRLDRPIAMRTLPRCTASLKQAMAT